MANPNFEQWARSYAGCDGGDIGSPERRAIWLCGIEWGGIRSAECIEAEMRCDESQPRTGYPDAAHNHAHIFSRQALKILSAIAGQKVSQYRDFCAQAQPFTQGSSGYFKLNLYPMAFKDTNPARWHGEFAQVTGFETKSGYLAWCRAHRLPAMRQWAHAARPKLILCQGKDYRADFKRAFHDDNVTFNHEPIDGRDLWWSLNADGTLVVIIPFMVNRNGLTRNDSIQKFGDRIAQLMAQHGASEARPRPAGLRANLVACLQTLKPRNPNRIAQVLHALQTSWEKEPDLRLGQLLLNTARSFNTDQDVFDLEDDVLLRLLQAAPSSGAKPEDTQRDLPSKTRTRP